MIKRIDAVKEHIARNRDRYVIGGVCLVTGIALGATIIAFKNGEGIGPSSAKVNGLVNLHSPANNVVIAQVKSPGNAGNVIQCIETQTIFSSQESAAKALGIDASRISRHLNGLLDNAKGLHFRIIREGTF